MYKLQPVVCWYDNYNTSYFTSSTETDYLLSDTSLRFDSDDSTMHCIEVALFPDNNVEGNESFQIILSSTFPYIDANDSAVINIIDDDGKLSN